MLLAVLPLAGELSPRVWGLGIRGLGFRDSAFGFRVLGFKFGGLGEGA